MWNPLTSLANGVTGVVSGQLFSRIALWGCAILLTTTIVLGYLLKHSYEAQGTIKAELAQASQLVVNQKDDLAKNKASCDESLALASQSVVDKAAIATTFQSLGTKLPAYNPIPVNSGRTTSNESQSKFKSNVLGEQLDPVTISVLHAAECKAGADCPAQ